MPSPPLPKRPQTTKAAKRAFNKRGGSLVSDAERRQIARAVELEKRAAKIRQKDERRKENKRKRDEKEEKHREVRRRMGREESPVKVEEGQLRLLGFLKKQGDEKKVEKDSKIEMESFKEDGEAESCKGQELFPECAEAVPEADPTECSPLPVDGLDSKVKLSSSQTLVEDTSATLARADKENINLEMFMGEQGEDNTHIDALKSAQTEDQKCPQGFKRPRADEDLEVRVAKRQRSPSSRGSQHKKGSTRPKAAFTKHIEDRRGVKRYAIDEDERFMQGLCTAPVEPGQDEAGARGDQPSSLQQNGTENLHGTKRRLACENQEARPAKRPCSTSGQLQITSNVVLTSQKSPSRTPLRQISSNTSLFSPSSTRNSGQKQKIEKMLVFEDDWEAFLESSTQIDRELHMPSTPRAKSHPACPPTFLPKIEREQLLPSTSKTATSFASTPKLPLKTLADPVNSPKPLPKLEQKRPLLSRLETATHPASPPKPVPKTIGHSTPASKTPSKTSPPGASILSITNDDLEMFLESLSSQELNGPISSPTRTESCDPRIKEKKEPLQCSAVLTWQQSVSVPPSCKSLGSTNSTKCLYSKEQTRPIISNASFGPYDAELADEDLIGFG